MFNKTVTVCSEQSLIGKGLYKLKVNVALKECYKIKDTLKKKSLIDKDDLSINIVVSDTESNEIKGKYVAYKGYNKDGSKKPLTIHTIENGQLMKVNDIESRGLMNIDLYEESICIYNYSILGNYAEGYLVCNERSKDGYIMNFSNKKVKVFLKNANTHKAYNSVTEYLNKDVL
ncbi:hypothetical protein N3C_0342 [Clostridium sp. N3C]|uniref:hypothetical protein n=1 Tax=Clostridium sp. N3C TaxID=1776758 RepID=UPI00092DEF6C|nr:hypothetical protein [Clostridium sp. N3C]SCN21643.1 hypothetical protein N3C_0342 [Clostridium sp. N3C]